MTAPMKLGYRLAILSTACHTERVQRDINAMGCEANASDGMGCEANASDGMGCEANASDGMGCEANASDGIGM